MYEREHKIIIINIIRYCEYVWYDGWLRHPVPPAVFPFASCKIYICIIRCGAQYLKLIFTTRRCGGGGGDSNSSSSAASKILPSTAKRIYKKTLAACIYRECGAGFGSAVAMKIRERINIHSPYSYHRIYIYTCMVHIIWMDIWCAYICT